MGKSLLALQFARHAAMHERQRVLFASLEMSDSETAQRHLAAESGVDPERLHLGNITADDWPALLNAAETPPACRFTSSTTATSRCSSSAHRPDRSPFATTICG